MFYKFFREKFDAIAAVVTVQYVVHANFVGKHEIKALSSHTMTMRSLEMAC